MPCRHQRHSARSHSIIKHSAHDLTIYPVCIFGDCNKLVSNMAMQSCVKVLNTCEYCGHS